MGSKAPVLTILTFPHRSSFLRNQKIFEVKSHTLSKPLSRKSDIFLFCQICPGGNRLHNFAETCITPLLLVVNLIRSGSLMQASSSFSVCAPLI